MFGLLPVHFCLVCCDTDHFFFHRNGRLGELLPANMAVFTLSPRPLVFASLGMSRVPLRFFFLEESRDHVVITVALYLQRFFYSSKYLRQTVQSLSASLQTESGSGSEAMELWMRGVTPTLSDDDNDRDSDIVGEGEDMVYYTSASRSRVYISQNLPLQPSQKTTIQD
jgi:hypothetical protein